MGRQMNVSMSVGMWRSNGNPNPITYLDKILHTHPQLSKEGFSVVLTQAIHYPGPGGPETLKPVGHIVENCLQNKSC